MITAALIQIVVFVTYVAYIYQQYGVLTSISASTDYLPKDRRYLFMFFCWALALPMFFHGMGLTWAFAAGGLFFTGITLNHSDDRSMDKKIHVYATLAAITLLFLGVLIKGYWMIPTFFVLSCLPVLKTKNEIWWIEILAFTWILLFLVLR